MVNQLEYNIMTTADIWKTKLLVVANDKITELQKYILELEKDGYITNAGNIIQCLIGETQRLLDKNWVDVDENNEDYELDVVVTKEDVINLLCESGPPATILKSWESVIDYCGNEWCEDWKYNKRKLATLTKEEMGQLIDDHKQGNEEFENEQA
jgi:hypothetical protein